MWSPQGRNAACTVTVCAVARSAARGIHLRAVRRVGPLRWRDLNWALARETDTSRCAARKPCNIGSERDHLAAGIRRRSSVHAVEETFGEPILQRDKTMSALIPLRKRRVAANERTSVRLRASSRMTCSARHARGNKRSRIFRRLIENVAPVGDELASRTGGKSCSRMQRGLIGF